MAHLVGIDVGTTNIKIGVYRENGDILEEKICPTPFYPDKTGGMYNPDNILNSITDAITGFNDTIKLGVAGLSVSSFAETMVGIDSAGAVICGGLAWFDTRTEAQFRRMQSILNPHEVYSLTGLMPHHIYSFYKLLWHREHRKSDFNRVHCWTSISGYILYALSGKMSFDYSLASRTMFFNQHKRSWWEQMIDIVGIPKERMAEVVPSGTVLGRVKKSYAGSTGLRPEVKIVTGGHDHICAALATGVFRTGNMLISTGTTESITMSLDQIPDVHIESMKRPFWWGHHTASGRLYALNGIYSGGYTVDWLLKTLNENYDVFNRCSMPQDSHIPFFIPYLRGGEYPESRGALLNLDGTMDRENLLQGTIAGLCFEMRFVWEDMVHALNMPVTRVVNAGGGSNNRYWMEMKATVLGHSIEVPEDREGSAKGAALLAGIGSGVYRDEDEAFSRTFRLDREYHPVAVLEEKLAGMYDVYAQLIDDLKALNMKIRHSLNSLK